MALGVRPTFYELKTMSPKELATWLVETGIVKQYGEFDAEPEWVPAGK